MVRVLHIVSSLNFGGIETFIMNVYRNIERKKIQFDFIVPSNATYDYEKEIYALGGNIYKIPTKARHPLQNIYTTIKIIRSNHYNIVHRHSGSSTMALDLISAKLGGATIRIAHSHNSKNEINRNYKKEILQFAFSFLVNCFCTHRLACSIKAAQWMYGRKQTLKCNVRLIYNAIDVYKFKYNKKKREEYRNQLRLENEFVVGHVGRFSEQKNHRFLIDIFKEVKKKKDNSKLMLVGVGNLEDQIKSSIRNLGMENDVLFMGKRDDIYDLMQVMDAFILPSLYEGLGIVAVEAQAVGLPVFLSDVVPSEAEIVNVKFISLEKTPEQWASLILETSKNFKRENQSEAITKAGYDIRGISNELEKLYLNLDMNETNGRYKFTREG